MISPVKVKNSVRRYLDHESKERHSLRLTLQGISENLEESVIFGGMLREFGLGNERGFKSDIDIISRASRLDIYAAIKKYSPSMNKFGGYRFVSGGQLFDIWSFDDTWAFREGLVRGVTLEDIFKTTFFNLDTAAFHLKTNEFFYADVYLQALTSRILDLNLLANPDPAAMARRAISMAMPNNLLVTQRLGQYILNHANPRDLDSHGDAFVRALRKFDPKTENESFSFTLQTSSPTTATI